MKKTLSLFLAVLTLLSCVVLSVGAAEEQSVIAFADCDSMTGWTGWRDAMPSLDTKEYAQGRGSITLSLEGVAANAAPGVIFQFHYANPAKAMDISRSQALAFELYVANVAGVENVPFSFELNSSGKMDADEISGVLFLGDLVEGGLKEGWNTAVLPLSSLTARTGSFDATKCCFFRISNGATTIGTQGKTTTLKLDDLRFVGDASAVEPTEPSESTAPETGDGEVQDGALLFADCDSIGNVKSIGTADMSGTGWHAPGLRVNSEKKTQGAASVAVTLQGLRANAASGTVYHLLYQRERPVDITGVNMLVMDVYAENAEGFVDTMFEIELRSVGWTNATGDSQERNINIRLAAYTVGTFGDGWNRVEIPLSQFSKNDKFDPSKCCYFRMFNRTADIGTVGKTTVLGLDNIHFETLSEDGAPRTTRACFYLASGAVYQQNEPLNIWGEAPVGTVIAAELYDASGKCISSDETTAESTEWLLTLDGQKGGYSPYSVKLTVDGAPYTTVTDVLFGELWLASGQSNMDMLLKNTYEYDEVIAEADDKYLRVFQTQETPTLYSTPQVDIRGSWVLGDNTTRLADVSAISYSFAKSLRETLDVPVAVIAASRGATKIETWLSAQAIDADAQLKAAMQSNGSYMTSITQPADMSAMYNGKIYALSHLSAIRGLIWYQGESSVGQGELYDEQLNLLQDSWGEHFGFGKGEMPLIYAQLAPYALGTPTQHNMHRMSDIKQSFLNFYLAHPTSTAMVPIYDVSLRYQDTQSIAHSAVIHPTTKLPVAQRMALAALGLCYGGAEATAPVVKEVRFEHGTAYVTFDHIADGLTTCNDTNDVLGFALGNDEGEWVNATAKLVKSDTVKVTAPYMSDACYVSYAWDDLCTDANLMGSHGIPAAPFSTADQGGFGSRYYLHCDGDVFVTTSFEQHTPQGTGAAAYTNVWTITERAEVSYDNDTRAEGLASVKAVYEAGAGEAVVGMDLTQAMTYSVSAPLTDAKTLTVQVKNGDARDKSIRLRIENTGSALYTEAQTLAANADFATLTFDLTTLTYENGRSPNNAGWVVDRAVGLSLCIEDAESGSVWIDNIQLGTDPCVAPEDEEPQPPADEPTDPQPDAPKPQSDHTLLIVIIIAAAVVVASVSVVIVVCVKYKKK